MNKIMQKYAQRKAIMKDTKMLNFHLWMGQLRCAGAVIAYKP